MTKIPLYIAAAGLVLIAVKWAFLHDRRLPRHRVRYLRIRLRLRLHPDKGHATVAELWWRWGRLAALRHASPYPSVDEPGPARVWPGRELLDPGWPRSLPAFVTYAAG